MTAEDMYDEEAREVEEGPQPRRWLWSALFACFFAMIANIFGAVVDFYGEVSVGLYRHSLWKEGRKADKETVKSFREQLAEL